MGEMKGFQQVWIKYIPVIMLKIKTAVRNTEPQELQLDKFDFENTASKSAVFQFKFRLVNGRVVYNSKATAVGLELIEAINTVEPAKDLIKSGSFTFSMSKFVLKIEAGSDE